MDANDIRKDAVGQTVGQNAPVDGESSLRLPLVLLRLSTEKMPVTGAEPVTQDRPRAPLPSPTH